MSNLTILTCNYNTPDLIVNLKKSINKYSCLDGDFFVVNTSTDSISEKILSENNINFVNCKGEIHGRGVNFGLQRIKTKYVLLLDSDVIITDDISNIFNKFIDMQLTLAGRVVYNEGGKQLHPRVDPSFCFINTENLNKFKIIFFDEIRTKLSRQSNDKVYNIGSTMFEDVIKNELLIGDFDLRNRKFIHYEGMSWRVQSYDTTKADTDVDFGGTHPNTMLKNIGEQVRLKYYKDVKDLL
jgi:GT2 family glycosyltransferase